jgi:hypothetical protein
VAIKKILFYSVLVIILSASEAADRPKYSSLSIAGWMVHMEQTLNSDSRARVVLEFLEEKLQEAEKVLPEQHLSKLKAVPIWLSENNGEDVEFYFYERRVYQGDFDPEKFGGIEIQNINNFLELIEYDQSVMIHELTHAYHQMNYEKIDKIIMRAYKNAHQERLYKKPEVRRNRKARGVYAAVSPYEYFAELSAIYFAGNYYYPFDRFDLKKHDRMGYEMIEQAWE